MDYQALRALIDTEPLNAARTDDQVLAWLQEATSTFVDVSWLDLCMWVATQGYRPTLAAAATSGNTDQVKTAAQHVLDCIAAGQPLFASDSRVRNAIAAAIPAGTARTALLALATASVTRAAAAGFPNVNFGDVQSARAI